MSGVGLTKQELIRRNYNRIYAHELAHKTAGGKYAGAITIEKNADGIPFAGHVPIQMPVLNRENPQATIDHADIVIKAALAPSDPSAQDYKVASEARQIKFQAQSIKNQGVCNKLDYRA